MTIFEVTLSDLPQSICVCVYYHASEYAYTVKAYMYFFPL